MTGSKRPAELAAVRLDGAGHGVAGAPPSSFIRSARAGGTISRTFGTSYGQGDAESDPEESPSPEGQTDVGVLGLRVHLEPGMSATLPIRPACVVLSEPYQHLERVQTPSRASGWETGKHCNGPMPGRRPDMRCSSRDGWSRRPA